MYSLIFLVNLPVQTIKMPVAKGSSVPAWPTFLIFRVFRIFLTTSKDVQCNGLLMSSTPPSSKGEEELSCKLFFRIFCLFNFKLFSKIFFPFRGQVLDSLPGF